jgi:hypothetical protein
MMHPAPSRRRVFLFPKSNHKENERMKIDLAETLKLLGLPISLVALFAAVLGLFGVSLDNILLTVEGLTGTFALIALVVNVLKWAGVVKDGTAGKWSAVGNLVVLVAVTIVFKLYPAFNFGSVDTHIAEFVKVAGIVFAYIIQIVGSKHVHFAMVHGLKIRKFSISHPPF